MITETRPDICAYCGVVSQMANELAGGELSLDEQIELNIELNEALTEMGKI